MFTGACLLILTPFYSYLPTFSLVDLCVPLFTRVYLCLAMSTRVYLCLTLFNRACLPRFTNVY